ncbi:hypothetical protein ACFQ1M_06490 [Sungkyunkwania multivorans]|uniref:Carboxypeptidase regulatory-like domain-containing protein n=1 Tax=Sungkyunkwania multivorans TaxID=1173618 RepID=A0ABW3CW11_9FLAO
MKKLHYIAIFFFGLYFGHAQNTKNADRASRSKFDIPIVVIDNNSNHTSLPTEFQLSPLVGYDAISGKMSIMIEALVFYRDDKGQEKTKISGSVDLNCCFGMIVRVDFLGDKGEVIHTTTTDENGDFKLHLPYGRIAVHSGDKVLLKFAKVELFDMSGKTHSYLVTPYKKRFNKYNRR